MIEANHTYIGSLVCSFYSGFRLKRAFQCINYIGDFSDNGKPILIIANHFSWWDGFIQYRLNKKLFKRKFHVMMLEEQLKKNMILSKGGAFSIKKQSKDILESLKYSSRLLTDNNNLVLLFPQGKTESIYTTTFRFESGLNHLLKNKADEIQLIFNINLIDYFSDKKPTLNIYYKPFIFSSADNKDTIEKAFNDFFILCKTKQLNSHEHR